MFYEHVVVWEYGVVIAQELPNLLIWVRFLVPVRGADYSFKMHRVRVNQLQMEDTLNKDGNSAIV